MLYNGDLFDVLPTLPEASVDACVTDPPYELKFMGKHWDGSGVAFQMNTWREVYRVLKPGAHVAAFGGTRTFHRMTSAIEDAGFEIRDCLSWLYGQGFPKSLNIGEGRGTALKPAWEPIVLARKPFKGSVATNVSAHGTGALNVDACRIECDPEDLGDPSRFKSVRTGSGTWSRDDKGIFDRGRRGGWTNGLPEGRWPSNVLLDEEAAAMLDEQSGETRSPASYVRGSDSQNVNAFGAGIGETAGTLSRNFGDVGGASRFFYVAKPSREERDSGHFNESRNIHPTVKPVELMRWLVKLVTPINGCVLDPFCGSGTTGMACAYELRQFIGIEREAEYVAIAERRIAACVPLFSERTA